MLIFSSLGPFCSSGSLQKFDRGLLRLTARECSRQQCSGGSETGCSQVLLGQNFPEGADPGAPGSLHQLSNARSRILIITSRLSQASSVVKMITCFTFLICTKKKKAISCLRKIINFSLARFVLGQKPYLKLSALLCIIFLYGQNYYTWWLPDYDLVGPKRKKDHLCPIGFDEVVTTCSISFCSSFMRCCGGLTLLVGENTKNFLSRNKQPNKNFKKDTYYFQYLVITFSELLLFQA